MIASPSRNDSRPGLHGNDGADHHVVAERLVDSDDDGRVVAVIAAIVLVGYSQRGLVGVHAVARVHACGIKIEIVREGGVRGQRSLEGLHLLAGEGRVGDEFGADNLHLRIDLGHGRRPALPARDRTGVAGGPAGPLA